ncbi:ABC transporter substrate-binding protein [Actinomadura sp. NTSP31]|uniref:ABC transporter substrate-binding protein n=1 Tax=Actinomadura sp. NTSP31 TaxID=1735447 RepID=UPI0035BFB971
MRSSKVISVAAAGAVVLSLGLSACGGGDDSGDGGGGKAKFDAGSKGIVNASDKKGGTLVMAQPDDFESLDPANIYYAYGSDFFRLYSRTLVTYTSKPGEEGTKPSPDLAQGLGTPSDGNKTWTYKLKPGLKYEDGSVIKAQDVKYAVARTFDRGVLRNGPSYFTQMLDAGDYKGPFKDKNLDHFKGVTTPDDSTVVFHLKAPFSEWDQLVMFSGQTVPVPQAKDTGTQYGMHPFSSGPYKWQADYKMKQGGTLVRNTYWDPKTDPNRKALPDKVVVQSGLSADEIDNREIDGTVQIDLPGTGVQAAARQKILSDPKLKANSDDPLAGFHWYMPINTEIVPNVECRKAIVYATNRDALWRAYGGDVGGEMATSIMPADIQGREKGTDAYTKAQVGFTGDVNAAKQALAKCGKPSGFAVTMLFRSDRPKEQAAAEAMEQALGRVGIKLTLKGYPHGTYTNEQFGSPEFNKKNNVGLGTYGWAPDWPTGYGYLQAGTDGKAIVDTGNVNISMLKDPQIDKMWNDVVKVNDPNQRAQIYNQIDQRVRDLAAIIPTVYAKSLLYRSPKLTNVYVHSGYGMYDYANLGVTS